MSCSCVRGTKLKVWVVAVFDNNITMLLVEKRRVVRAPICLTSTYVCRYEWDHTGLFQFLQSWVFPGFQISIFQNIAGILLVFPALFKELFWLWNRNFALKERGLEDSLPDSVSHCQKEALPTNSLWEVIPVSYNALRYILCARRIWDAVNKFLRT